jgi:multicomponent Na+:H+ antiporter subunit E
MKTFFLHLVIALTTSYELIKTVLADVVPHSATVALILFIIVFMLFWLTTPLYHPAYFRKLPKALALFVYFVKEMFVANLTIAYDILTPRLRMTPAVLQLPLSANTQLEITLLTVIISLTPGTMTLDVDEDRHIMYIHTLYLENGDIEKLRQSIKNGFERRLLELIR